MPSPSYHPNWHVRCISSPGPDTDLSLFISFDNARFLFGCGEGTQRAFVQKRLSMKGLNGIFIGSGSSRGRNGLAGILLTAADAGIGKLDVIGPPDIAHYVATLRTSVVRDSLKVNMHPYPAESRNDVEVIYDTPHVKVRAIALQVGGLDPEPSHESLKAPETIEIEVDSETPVTTDLSELTEEFESVAPITTPDEPDLQANDDASAAFIETASRLGLFRDDFRPSQLSRQDLEEWCNLIVADMFPGGPRLRVPGRRSPSKAQSPFVSFTSEFRPGRVSYHHPLPLPSVREATTDLVYILQAPPVRGKFDVERANALKVPSGPIRGRLVKGETVEVADDSVPGGIRSVRPEECLSGGGPGAILIVVTCSIDNLPALLSSSAFHRYQPSKCAPNDSPDHVHLIVHKVPAAVWRSPVYKEWMAAFGDTTQHLIADPDDYANKVYFNSSAWNLLHLSMAESTLFQPPYPEARDDNDRFEPFDLGPNTTFLQSGHLVKMHPPSAPELLPIHDRDIPFPTGKDGKVQAFAAAEKSMPEYVRETHIARDKIQGAPHRIPGVGDDISVTTLGTGSAIPSKYRNVSSTYLDIPGVGGILLDAGEGTLGQLRRRYGPEGIRGIYADLKMIFISHMHADHHLGLHAILEDRFKHGFTSKLYIVAPQGIPVSMMESGSWQLKASQEALDNIVFLDTFRLQYGNSQSRDHDKSPLLVSNNDASGQISGPIESPLDVQAFEDIFNGKRRWPSHNVLSDDRGQSKTLNRASWRARVDLVQDLGLRYICTPAVSHRGRAYGLVMEHLSGWKIVYSGDTTPCDALIQAGRDATLLIHEATLEDDKPEMALAKGHSTFSQAIEVGTKMKARHILLNHFSQRYPKLPKLPEPTISEEGVFQPVISVSFDLMTVQVKEMWKMAYLMDAISLLFKEDAEDADDVTSQLDHNVDEEKTAKQPAKKIFAKQEKKGKKVLYPSSEPVSDSTVRVEESHKRDGATPPPPPKFSKRQKLEYQRQKRLSSPDKDVTSANGEVQLGGPEDVAVGAEVKGGVEVDPGGDGQVVTQVKLNEGGGGRPEVEIEPRKIERLTVAKGSEVEIKDHYRKEGHGDL